MGIRPTAMNTAMREIGKMKKKKKKNTTTDDLASSLSELQIKTTC